MNTALTLDALNDLAYELALGYHPPEDLAARVRLPVQTIHDVAGMPEFRALVADARRRIDESGDKTRIVARKLVSELVPVIARLAAADHVDPKDRIAAFKELRAVAGINDSDGQARNGMFAIQINLGVH